MIAQELKMTHLLYALGGRSCHNALGALLTTSPSGRRAPNRAIYQRGRHTDDAPLAQTTERTNQDARQDQKVASAASSLSTNASTLLPRH